MGSPCTGSPGKGRRGRRPGLPGGGAALGAAALAVVSLLSCAAPCLRTEGVIVNENRDAFPGGELTVVTYNMLHGFGNRRGDATLEERLEILTRALAELRPDLILLQEASVTGRRRHCNVVDRIRAGLNGRLSACGVSYNSAFLPAHGSPIIGFFEGPAVLSRYEIVAAEKLRYRVQALLPPEGRIAVRATIRAAGGPIDAVSTHLTHRAERWRGRLKRTAQAEELARAVGAWAGGRRCVVIGGDLNAAPGSDAVLALRRIGAVDAWREANGGLPGYTAIEGAVTDAQARAFERIDYLFAVGRALAVRRAWLFLDRPVADRPGGPGPALWPSDHIGVAAVFRLE